LFIIKQDLLLTEIYLLQGI